MTSPPPSALAGTAAPTWRFGHFDTLGLRELDAIYRARQLVFTVEQACCFVDADGCDAASWHLAAWSDDPALPLAYARVVAPGVKYAEPSIGRVLTTAASRGTGLGRELVQRAIVACARTFVGAPIRISAQARLERFYADAGFVAVGTPYLEDGIPHIEMWREPPLR